jgi:hypothetical protein
MAVSGVIGGQNDQTPKGNAMRNRMLFLYVSAGAGILAATTFSAAPLAQALPLAAGYSITSEVQDSDIRRNVAYVCRRDAYGRTCTYVWPSGRSDRSYTGQYWSHTSRYQSQEHGYYPYGTGYYPWYWANPQGSD